MGNKRIKHFSLSSLPKNDPRYLMWLGSLKHKSPWNKGKTKLTDIGVKRISDTMKKQKIDNFSQWRINAKRIGLIPNPNKRFIKSKELAYLIGLILGDGHLGKTLRTECLRIVLGTDKPYLAKYTARVVENVIGKKPSLIKRTDTNCYNLTIYQKNLSKRFGVPLGARKNLPILLPKWVWKKNDFLISILKGLFEAEASYSYHKRTYTYNFAFSNVNVSLLNEVERGLRKLKYNPERRIKAVRLRKKKEVISFYQLINFRSYP